MKFVLIVGLVLFGTQCVSATFVVRSGDHADFTRITISGEPNTEWKVEQNGLQVRISPSKEVTNFDISRAFQRITRQRLNQLLVDGNSLVLNLACNCQITESAFGDELYIFDIQSGSQLPQPSSDNWWPSISAVDEILPTQDSRFFDTSKTKQELKTENQSRAVQLPPKPVGNSIDSKSENSTNFLTYESNTLRPVINVESFPKNNNTTAHADANLQNKKNLKQLEKKLVESIGRAATQGLLSPEIVTGDRTNTDTYSYHQEDSSAHPHTDTENFDMNSTASISPIAPTITENPGGGISISKKDEPDEFSCDDAEMFALQDWSAGDNFFADIPALRTSLFREFDQIDKEVQMALARAYLYYGFGAEAQQVINLDNKEKKTEVAAILIARLLDSSPVQIEFSHLMHCDSDVAFWSILANTVAPLNGILNTEAALRTLNKLPAHLRSHLGPRLSTTLRESGDVSGAAQAMRSSTRTHHHNTAAENLEQFEVELILNGDKLKKDQLENVISQNTEESPVALIKFVDLAYHNEDFISEDTLVLLKSYETEYRDTALEQPIKRAIAITLAINGNYEAALDIANNNSDLRENLNGVFADILSREPDDVTFLTYALNGSNFIDSAPPAAKLLISERLVNLGFSDAARQFLLRVPEATDVRRRDLVSAKIYLLEGNLKRAKEIIEKYEDDEFLEVQAQLLFNEGIYESSADIFRNLGDTEKAEKSIRFFRSQTELESLSQRQEASFASGSGVIEKSGSLGRAKAIAEEAKTLKDRVVAIFADGDQP